MKLSAKSKVISKGTSYSDKYESRRAQRLSVNKRGNTHAAINKLGQKHAALNLASVKGMAMTQAQKKKLLKKKARAEKQRQIEQMEDGEQDWESASSSNEEDQVEQ